MIEILDCTLRDGGYYTNWDFDTKLINNYFAAMENLPISYIEIGYRSLTNDGYKGEYNFCPEYVLKNARQQMPSKKIGIILNEKEVTLENLEQLLNTCRGLIDFVRMAVDPTNLERASITAKTIKGMGYETGFNVMYMSKWSEYPDFEKQVASLNGHIDSFAMVDSFGSMFPDDVEKITRKLKSLLNCKIGFHGHNNIELAFANTLAAINGGCDIIDSTITGMGRGAGNLRTEMLLAYLSSTGHSNIDFNNLSLTVSDFETLKEKYRWGTNLPYMVSGLNSLPQKDVMDWVTRRFYSINSILQALQNMKEKKGDNLKLPLFNTDKKVFETTLIIGGGPNAIKSASAIKQFILKNQDKEICIIHASSKNASHFQEIDVPQYFCLVGNEGYRLKKAFASLKLNKTACVLPPYPRKMGTYIPEKLMDNSFELKEITFTDQFQDSHTALALQTALELGIKNIYIAGYDGYDGAINENERMLTHENEFLLEKFSTLHSNIHMATITDTKYKGIKNQSVYRLLID